jgi:ABC-type Fe3+-hydroxamate transport system substrate-binding protein
MVFVAAAKRRNKICLIIQKGNGDLFMLIKNFKYISFFYLLFFIFLPFQVYSGCFSTAYKVEKVYVAGERIVSVMYHLGIVPEYWSGRKADWNKAEYIEAGSNFRGCVKGLVGPKKGIAKKFVQSLKDYPVLVEAVETPDLFIPSLTPEKISSTIQEFGKKPLVIDFTKGIDHAVMETGKYFGLEDKAKSKILFYKKSLKRAMKQIEQAPKNKKVVVFSGIYQDDTGKAFVRAELSNGYSDKYILSLADAKNCNSNFFTKEEIKDASGGYIIVRKKKIREILLSKPDLVIATGDSFAVENEIYKALSSKEQKQINLKIFSLPSYKDADPLAYPSVIMKWASALKAG